MPFMLRAARRRPSALLSSTLAASLLTASLGCQRGEPPAVASPELDAVTVGPESLYTVALERLAVGPRVSGSLEAKQQAVLRSEASGSVIELKAELGDPVKQGQVLARIEQQGLAEGAAAAEASLHTAETDHVIAQRQLARTEILVDAGAVPTNNLEVSQGAALQAASRVEEARARLAASRKQLAGATIQAPFDGIVSERSANLGDVVAPGAALFTIIEPSTMRLTGSVPSEEVSALVPGTDVVFDVRGYPGQTFVGKIERVAPSVDAATRQIKVLISIPNPGGRLIAGLFAEGRIAKEARQTIVVPRSAIDAAGTEPKVARVAQGKVETVVVKTGLVDDRTERVEVTDGLKVGDVVLTGGARTLAPGTKVEIAVQTAGAGK